ncbi:Opr family porin, partial [Arcobacteraceae bacterium]|nr:Opr family porin [Arcobacteraceae bacterium]
SGDITLYGESINASGTNDDSGFTMGSIGVGYETDSINGFKGAVAFRANHNFTEQEDENYSDGSDPEAALSIANISYSMDNATITAGRQEIDLEWIGDFHEAVIGEFTFVPDTTITIGHSTRYMAVDADAVLEKMADIGDSGVTFIDGKYEGIENTVINPYFMDAGDIGNAYGLKATTNIAGIDLTAHYAATNEDVSDTEDGSIAHLEIGTSISDISVAVGYITTDKDGGIGSLDTVGDNIDPFEEGGDAYGVDADTYYISAGVELASIELGAFYGTTTSGEDNDKNSEIFFTAGTSISENLGLELLLSSTDAEDSDDDADKIALTATYSF